MKYAWSRPFLLQNDDGAFHCALKARQRRVSLNKTICERIRRIQSDFYIDYVKPERWTCYRLMQCFLLVN